MKDKNDILRKLRANMVLFGRVVIPNMFSAKSPAFHDEIAQVLLDDKIKQVNIIAPRGHAKSSIVGGVYPLYHLMFDKGKKLIVLVSRTQDHAVKLLGTIKDVLDYSAPFRSIFGYWGMNSAKSWAKTEVQLKDGSMIICKGTGQQLRGIKVGNQRPTLIIVDDPEDEMNTKTAEAMEGNLRWLLQSAVPSVDPKQGKIAVIGTPQHQRCLVETLKEMKGWKNMHFSPNMSKRIALWEDWQPIKKLEQKKIELESINRISVFYREYLCEIVGDEDQLFKESYFKYYKGNLEYNKDNEAYMRFEEKDGKPCEDLVPVNIFMGVDPASSTKRTADYSTVVSVAIDKHNNKYVLPYFRKRSTPMNLADSIIKQFKKYKPTKTRIESVGYQEMLREYLRQQSEEQGLFISGLEIKENPRTSKSSRLETLEPHFAQGKMYITPNMPDLKNELLLYPRSKHDDLLDGLFYAMKGNYVPYHSTNDLKPQHSEVDYLQNDHDWLLA